MDQCSRLNVTVTVLVFDLGQPIKRLVDSQSIYTLSKTQVTRNRREIMLIDKPSKTLHERVNNERLNQSS